MQRHKVVYQRSEPSFVAMVLFRIVPDICVCVGGQVVDFCIGTMAYAAYRPPYGHQHLQSYVHDHGYIHAPSYSHAPPAPNYNYTNNDAYPLKPLPQATTTAYPALARLNARHKRRIRILKAASRILSTILSLATSIPLAMTLVKFLQTKDEYLTVDGQSGTAWAAGTITWYTYLYFGVAAVALILNIAILASYCLCGDGVKGANRTAEVEGWWSGLQWTGEAAVWIASVVIYRYGREPDEEGKFKDLWGWTCSPVANAIQEEITNVDFSVYCNVQVSKLHVWSFEGSLQVFQREELG